MIRTPLISDFQIDETYLWRRINSEERLERATKQPEIDYILNRRASYNTRRAYLRLPLVEDWSRLPVINSAYLAQSFIVVDHPEKTFAYGPFKSFKKAQDFSKGFMKANWDRTLGESNRVTYGDRLHVYTFSDHQLATGWTFARIKLPKIEILWNPVPPPNY